MAPPAYLLLLLLAGCATTPSPHAARSSDPGRLDGAATAVWISGLRPCNDGADVTLHLDPARPVNVLVHGCRGSAGRFRALAEVLAFHGQQSACFTYDDRDSLMKSSGELARSLADLSSRLKEPQLTVIGHSQGGLVARKALVADRPDPLQARGLDLRLVTVSAPFAGINAANPCAIPLLRVATLGINDFACWLISGDKWFEITSASDFIRRPGRLVEPVRRHLKVVTDERGTCREADADGRCIEDDFIFSVAEQRHPEVARSADAEVEVAAGHIEIVGESGVAPLKLIAVLQREGVVRPTPPEQQTAFRALLARLYGPGDTRP